MASRLTTLDGSMLEGGGQILRNSAALSAITGAPLQVERIRAKRSRPGLQPQHLTGLQLVADICGGRLEGGEVGSCAITLRPGAGPPRPGHYAADTRTAGSCGLMLQAAMPVCVFAQPGDGRGGGAASAASCTELELRGGTDAEMAPPAGYLAEVLAPLLARLYGGLMEGLEVRLDRRGFYPRGGGQLTARVPRLPPGSALPPLDLTRRGRVTQVTIRAFAAGRVRGGVAQRMAAAAEAGVRRALERSEGRGAAGRVPVVVEAAVEPPDRAVGDGCGVLLYADTDTGCRLGASAKGERGVTAEAVGEAAAAELAEALASGACVDQWMQDQLIIWMALAEGTSRVLCGEPSVHCRTAMVVAERVLPGVRFRLHRPVGRAHGQVGQSGQSGPVGPQAEVHDWREEGAEEQPQPQGVRAQAVHEQQRQQQQRQREEGQAQRLGKRASSGSGGGEAGAEDGREGRKEGAGAVAGGGLWLIECDGAGWTVGRRLTG